VSAASTQFWRLVITVPHPLAAPYGSALVELGAGAVEERSSNETQTELYISFPESEAIEPWQAVTQSLYLAFAEELGLPPEGFAVRVERCDIDYHAEWLSQLTRQQLTDSLLLLPTSDRLAVPPEMEYLRFEPHPSFGDGSHPTTRLAARQVEAYCLSHPDCRVLDVGAGNGVLSLVAACSGAGTVWGIDIDADAVRAAIHNAELNRLESRCSFTVDVLESITWQFDLVVANLEPRTQVELLEAMAARVRPGGVLFLTGFLAEQAEIVTNPLTDMGLFFCGSEQADDYVLLHWVRRDAGANPRKLP